MSSETGYFKLGLLVISGVALIVGGIIFFGAGALFKQYANFETATTHSVDGLDVGAAVKFNGVTVGKVSHIDLAMWKYPNSDRATLEQISRYVDIELQIDRDALLVKSAPEIKKRFGDAVNRGLRARMASSGLTGPPYIELVFLDPKSAPATPPPWTPREAYIPSAQNQISQAVADVTDILGQVKQVDITKVVTDLRTLLNHTDDKVTQLEVRELQSKAVALVDEVRGSNKRVKAILDNPKIDPAISNAADDLPKISGRLRDATAQINDILRDPRIKVMLANLNDTTASAAPAAADVRRLIHKLDVLMSAQSQDLEEIVANLRRVLEDATVVTDEAKKYPSRLLFGQPPPRITPGSSQ